MKSQMLKALQKQDNAKKRKTLIKKHFPWVFGMIIVLAVYGLPEGVIEAIVKTTLDIILLFG